MNIDIQRSSERGRTKTNWLTSYHSFSFGNYFNPARMNFGLLRVLNDDIIEPGGGFPTHHHDNMEIVTIVLEGALQHKDSSGGEGIINPGEVQAMSAGRGIYHSEFNASDKEPVHLLQIWVDTASEVKAGYSQKKIRKSLTMPIVDGEGHGGLKINQDAQFYLGELDGEIKHEIPAGKGSYVFIIKGSVEISRHTLRQGDAAGITDGKEFNIRALEDSEVLIIDVPMD